MSETDTNEQRKKIADNRLGIVLIGAFALGISLLVSTIPVLRLPVVIKVIVDEVGFQFDDDWEVIDLPLEEVAAANWSTLELVGNVTTPESTSARKETATNLVVRAKRAASTWSARLTSDHLRLNLTVPAKSLTRLSVDGERDRSLNMKIADGGAFASIDSAEELQLRCNSCLLESTATKKLFPSAENAWRLHAANRKFSLHGSDVPALFFLRRAGDSGEVVELASDTDLRALQVDFGKPDVGAAPVSAISGPGTIAFPSLKSDPIQINVGEFLHIVPARGFDFFRSPEPLRVHRISLGDVMEIELRGDVSELASGHGGALRSRMPTILQYIYWNTWLQMVFGATLTLGATVISILVRLGFLAKG